jgi:hypothetical protein
MFAMNWKIPLLASGIGVALCVACLADTLLVDWNVHLYNPTLNQLSFYLCPALILQIATADAPVYNAANQRLIYELWVVAAIVNALLYGLIGLILAMILRIWRRITVMQSKLP